jgi:hypothetical protein
MLGILGRLGIPGTLGRLGMPGILGTLGKDIPPNDVARELAPPVVDASEDAKFPALIELATLDSEGNVAIKMYL